MKGYRTLIINLGLAGAMGMLTWAAGVQWTEYFSPTMALIITNVVNVGLRIVTDTPVGKKFQTQ